MSSNDTNLFWSSSNGIIVEMNYNQVECAFACPLILWQLKMILTIGSI
jgi:hypothetical protein